MTDNALAETAERVGHMDVLTPKQRGLVEGMVHFGLNMKDAAQHAGMSERQAWNVIRKPEILKAIRDETQVLRSSVRPRMIHRAVKIADQDENKSAAVMAIKAVLGDEEHGRVAVNINITPGYAVDLGAPRERVIEHVAHEVIRVDGITDGAQGE
jgi:hypothetical protein